MNGLKKIKRNNMKKIHVLSIGNPSRLQKFIDVDKIEFELCSKDEFFNKGQNIYITSHEEIKKGDWVKNITIILEKPFKLDADGILYTTLAPCKFEKIIITTDQDLIKDGVQAIDDEFLEWFVKNPNCEEVEITRPNKCKVVGCDLECILFKTCENIYIGYEIIIPKEESKQLFTDYPITELGDEEFKEAPIRKCGLISYDNNKYCYVKVEGIEKEIKRCYIYSQKARCGEVDCISDDEIKELLKEKNKHEILEEAKIYAVNQWVKGYNHLKLPNFEKNSIAVDFGNGWDKAIEWQQERSYSKEDLRIAFFSGCQSERQFKPRLKCWEEFIEKFKKK